ncbi:MAG: DUF2156 domain-containing protein [Bacillota bacterium]|jgi:hypothetical protein
MLQFKSLKIEDKALFNSYLAGRRYDLATYNFTSFFLWKDWDPYSYLELDGALCVKSDFFGWDAVLVPISPDDQIVLAATEHLIDWYKKRGVPFLLTGVSQEMVDLYEKAWPDRFIATEFPGGFNYVYYQQELAVLHGKKFRNKRNHISAFLRDNDNYEFIPLNQDSLPEVKKYLTGWYKHHLLSDDLVWERFGLMQGLEVFTQLDCIGICLLINDKIEAITCGEELNEDTFMVHIEKGNTDIRGIYPFLNQQFVVKHCEDYTYINRMEDMDQANLRKAKKSYHPCKMIKKYHLSLRND